MIIINVEEFDDMIMILMILLMIMITLEWPWCLRMVIWCGRPGGGATRFRLWLVLQHIHPSWHFQNAHARYTGVIHLIWGFICDKCYNTFIPADIFKTHMLTQRIHFRWCCQRVHPWHPGRRPCIFVVWRFLLALNQNNICLIFLRCVFSNVSSKNLGQSK